jgi:hypothetical protein
VRFTVDFSESKKKFKTDFGEVIELGAPELQEKTLTKNGRYTPDKGFAGFKAVTVAVDTSDAYEQGRKDEHDEFWDAYQSNGERRSYSNAFSGSWWTDANFKPKYDIIVNDYAERMFENSGITDLKGALEEQGVVLDTSRASRWTNAFYSSAIVRLPVIDMRSLTNQGLATNVFSASKIVYIEKLILPNTTQAYNSNFIQASRLEQVVFDGEVKASGLNLQWSESLNKDSITSLINVLSSTTSGLSVTISKTAKETAFTDADWATLIATKPNWTINLA